MKICSLLPSATEILFALGLGDDVVAVSHECDFPPEAARRPRVVETTVDQNRLTSGAIDRVVRQSLRERTSLYRLDLERLRELEPELVVTQQLCEICAIETGEVFRALATLPNRPRLLSLHPHTLDGVFGDIVAVGRETGRLEAAQGLVASLRARIARVQTLVAGAQAPRVACLEWLEPLMACGHWVPEQVRLAGGREVLGREGQPSRYATWQEVLESQADVLVLMPCGFPIARTRQELPVLTAQPGWRRLPAVQAGRVALVDGPAYFNRSGPRLVDGVEILAGLLHPDRCASLVPADAAARL